MLMTQLVIKRPVSFPLNLTSLLYYMRKAAEAEYALQ